MVVGIQDELLRLHSVGLLSLLLADKSQRSRKTENANRSANILWATDAYQSLGPAYGRDREMEAALITGTHSDVIKNRARKAMEQQSERIRKHGEVFTPRWVCRKMVSHGDAMWFGKDDPFLEDDQPAGAVVFPEGKKWKRYIDERRLEITCGEAPYLVQRYDVETGEVLSLRDRQGMLDRKLRVAGEQAADEGEWLTWAFRAFEATYGYEFQGDNVLIARINLLMTFEDYLKAKWRRVPTRKEYERLIKIITWNLWQMDGLTGRIPYCHRDGYEPMNLFQSVEEPLQEEINFQPRCRIYDWRRGNSLEYLDVNTGGRNMKFDFIIGNPPYQDDIDTKGDRANPIYNAFMEQSYKIADVVELITPARFLFNAGQTPKVWNKKMLNDECLKVLSYKPNAADIFPTTDIKGGVVITIRDANKKYGAIGVFTPYTELNGIVRKIKDDNSIKFLDSIVSSRGNYRTTEEFKREFPDAVERLGKGTGNMLVSNFFEKIPEVIVSNQEDTRDSCIKVLCRVKGKRTFCYIKKKYIQYNAYIEGYNVASPEANGNGKFGEKLTVGEILAPGEGATDTFLSIGSFASKQEAIALQKYIKTKFFRALLGTKKVTQHCPPAVWEMIPLQDFTSSSDIDWSKSVAEIDQQLYKKYGLNEKEIQFIETHVKEMK